MNERQVLGSDWGRVNGRDWVIRSGDDRRLRKPPGFSTLLQEA
jgi:hypothetical protein